LIGEADATAMEADLPRWTADAASDGYDWSGWWYLYHPNSNGQLVLDKFTTALVLKRGVVTAMWSGCFWLHAGRPVSKGDNVTAAFSPPSQRFSSRMTRAAPDEASALLSDNPKTAHVMKRVRDHGECAGYTP
jgi:hypothetical protein